jgi:hypothetical protein
MWKRNLRKHKEMITTPKMYGVQCDICKKHLMAEHNIIAYNRKQDIIETAEAMGWEMWNNGRDEYHYCPTCKEKLDAKM